MNWFLALFLPKKAEMETPAVFNTTFVKEPPSNYAVEETINWPAWLEDEQALRDEAVIFGITRSSLDEKLKAIELFYQQIGIQTQKRLAQYDEKILELNLEQEAKDIVIKKLEEKQEAARTSKPQENNFIRYVFGLGLSVAMSVGTYFLIAAWLKPSFSANASWISWGIFLTGMFNLFAPISFLHDTTRPTWRQLLEGFGLPFACATLVSVLTFEQMGLAKSIAVFTFVFFAFIFSGKLLLANVTKLIQSFKIFIENLKLSADKKAAEAEWQQEIKNLEKEILELRASKWKIKPELDETSAEIQKITAEKNAALHIFKSEFELASRFAQENNIQKLKLQ
jgi:hypothetical protein